MLWETTYICVYIFRCAAWLLSAKKCFRLGGMGKHEHELYIFYKLLLKDIYSASYYHAGATSSMLITRQRKEQTNSSKDIM